MLKRRIIPKLQMLPNINNPKCMELVFTIGFSEAIPVGSPVSQAKIFQAQCADELIFIDLSASKRRKSPNFEIIREAAKEIFMPFTVGGGVSSIDDFRQLLMNGADKVCLNTGAVLNPKLITNASEMFGAQCVVLSIDYKKNSKNRFTVWTHGGKVDTGLDPIEWAKSGEEFGAGEILMTSIDRDGSRMGLELELTRSIVENSNIPVITSGGCGLASHFVDGFIIGKVDAIASGTFFFVKDESFMQIRAKIKNAGIPIRIHT